MQRPAAWALALALFNKQALGNACSSTICLFQGKSDPKIGCQLDVASEKAPGGSQAPQVELQQQAHARIHGQQRRCQDVQGICCSCTGSTHSTGRAQHGQRTCTHSLASRQTIRHTDTCQAPNNRLSWHGSKRACQRPRQPHSAALSMLMICHHLGECAGEPKLAIMLDTHTQGHAHPRLLGRKAPAGPEQGPTKPRHAAAHGPGGC